MIRHKRTIEQKFKAIVAMIVAMGLVSGFTLQDGTISDAWSLPVPGSHTTHTCTRKGPDTPYDVWWEENGQHQEKCSDCDDATTLEDHDFSDTTLYWYDDDVDARHHIKVCAICGFEDSELHNYDSPMFAADNKHVSVCKVCGKPYIVGCELYYVKKGAGEHYRKCRHCDRADVVLCNNPGNEKLDADGFCEVCEPNAIAAKNALKDLYDVAKASPYNWKDSFNDAQRLTWLNSLSDSAFAALEAKLDDFNTKTVLITDDEYDYGNIINYLDDPANDNKVAFATFLTNAIANNWRSTPPGGATPLADPQSVTIKILDKNTGDPVDDAVLHITGTSTTSNFNCDLKNNYTITLVSGTTSTITPGSPTKLQLADDTYTISNQTTANGYKPFESDPYSFTTNFSTTPFFSALTNTPKDWVLKSPSPNVLNIYIEPLPKVEVELLKSDDTSHPLTSGASIKLKDGGSEYEIYNPATDKVVVGTPNGATHIKKIGDIITILPDTDITVDKDTIPTGYEWVTGDYKFQVNAAGSLTVPTPTANFLKSGNKLQVIFTKTAPTEITIKQFKTSTTTPELTTGSLEITNGTDKATWKPGNRIFIGDPGVGKTISQSSDGTITLKANTTGYTVSSDVAPFGYKKLAASHTFDVSSDGKSITVTSAAGVFEADGTKGIKVFFDEGDEITLSGTGDGEPSSYKFRIKDSLGNAVDVDKSTGKIKLGAGTYTLSANSAKSKYIAPSGTFTIDASGKVSAVSGSVEKVSDTEVRLKFDKKIPDIKVYKYPKKDGKDEPVIKKDNALNDWSYVVEQYVGDETTDEKIVKDTKDKNWDEVDKVELKSTSSDKYDTLDAGKLTVGKYYRFKGKDGKYAYFYLKEDGTVKDLKGNIDTNDDGDEIYLWDDDPDEDSDDVIAIHKVNNTGTDLSGAHLQIYLYSDSNTLAYGSSSTTSSSTSSSSSSSSNTSSSSSSSTNSSTSSSTTKAKTTPAKPSVATSDVKFDWTSSGKAKVIDIDKLEKGKNYTLREVSAPSGYETPAYDFVFKYGTDGKLSIVRNYNGLLSVTGNKLVLKNQTPTEAAATRPKTGDHSKLALWLDICIVMLGGLYLSGYSIFEAFTEKKKVKVVAKKKPNNRRKR